MDLDAMIGSLGLTSVRVFDILLEICYLLVLGQACLGGVGQILDILCN